MNWLKETFLSPTSVESALMILALTIALGLALGSISVRGIKLGVAGNLFAGLAFGHFGLTPNGTVLGFARVWSCAVRVRGRVERGSGIL